MRGRPLLDKAERGPRLERTGQQVPVEGKSCLLTLILSVEVSGSMFPVKHPNHDAEEDRDNRHMQILPLRSYRQKG